MADKKYKFTCKGWKIESCEEGGADHTHILMHDSSEIFWDNLSYDDLVQFEGAMMGAVCGALGQLGMDEAEKKKGKK